MARPALPVPAGGGRASRPRVTIVLPSLLAVWPPAGDARPPSGAEHACVPGSDTRSRRLWRLSAWAWRRPALRPYVVRLWRWRVEKTVTSRVRLPKLEIRRARRVRRVN